MNPPHVVRIGSPDQRLEFVMDVNCNERRSSIELAEVISSALSDGERVDYDTLKDVIDIKFGDDNCLMDVSALRDRERRCFAVLRAMRNELVHQTELARFFDSEIKFSPSRVSSITEAETDHLADLQDDGANRRIVMPPGTRLSSLLQLMLGATLFRRYVAPAIADMQEEHFEALSRGDKWDAWSAIVRGYLFMIPGWLWGMIAAVVAKFTRSS